jgi:hypothetical protein
MSASDEKVWQTTAVQRDLVLSIIATDKLAHISFRVMSIESQDWNHPASHMPNNSAQFR